VAVGDVQGEVRVFAGDKLVRRAFLSGPIVNLAFDRGGTALLASDKGAGWWLDLSSDARSVDDMRADIARLVPYVLEGSELRARAGFTPPIEEPRPIEPGFRLATAVIDCPLGTAPLGAPYPAGTAAWCAIPGGSLEGPERAWTEDGTPTVDKTYRDGQVVQR
jgi:hypothetical protein